MSTQAMIASQRVGAEVCHGADLCTRKSMSLLKEFNMPLGLLPLPDMEEIGYNRSTGFVWMKLKKPTTHVFKAIGKTVSYAAEMTAFVEDRRMKRMTGVKCKELLLLVSVSDVYIDDPESKRIIFKSSAGINLSFPVSAFDPWRRRRRPRKTVSDAKISGARSYFVLRL